MSKIKTVSRTELREKNKAAGKKLIAGASVYVIVTIILAVIQTCGFELFGCSVAFILSLVCSVGFVFGEKEGAALGLFGGFVCDCLGTVGFSILPLFYMLCGYICGIMIKWFLSRNLPSFVIYCLIVGILREGVTFLYYMLYSENFRFFETVIKVLIPEYFAFVLFSPLMYLLSVLIKRILMRNRK